MRKVPWLGVSAGVAWFESALRMPRPPKEGEIPTRFEVMELVEGTDRFPG